MIALVRTTAQELPALHKTPNFSILVKKESVYIGLINKKNKGRPICKLVAGGQERKIFFQRQVPAFIIAPCGRNVPHSINTAQ